MRGSQVLAPLFMLGLTAVWLLSACGDDGRKTSTETIIKRKPGPRVSPAVQRKLPAYTGGFVMTNLCPGLTDSVRNREEKRLAERVRRRTDREFGVLVGQLQTMPDKLVAVRGTLSDEPRDIIEDMTVRQLARDVLSGVELLPGEEDTKSGQCALRYRARLRAALR